MPNKPGKQSGSSSFDDAIAGVISATGLKSDGFAMTGDLRGYLAPLGAIGDVIDIEYGVGAHITIPVAHLNDIPLLEIHYAVEDAWMVTDEITPGIILGGV